MERSPQDDQSNGCNKDRTVSEWFERMKRDGAAVLGLGTANLPLVEWLYARGIKKITVRDRRRLACPPKDTVLSAPGVTLKTGDGYLADLSEGVLFRTPSLHPDTKEIQEAVSRGAILTSESELFCKICPARLFAVTGSDGKTTTTMLTGDILRKAGIRVFVGGNIGTPLLSYADLIRKDDAAVTEFSSFQLQSFRPFPYRAAITNISENHLDWHRNMEEYTQAKEHIAGEVTVLNAACRETAHLVKEGSVILFSARMSPGEMKEAFGDVPLIFTEDGKVKADDGRVRDLFACSDLPLPGLYNLENAMCAAALTLRDVPPDAIREAIRTFRGAPHRTEYVGTFRSVACYDSSIDTTPARTAATLSAFGEQKPVVIVGGQGKNLSFAPLAETLYRHASAVVLTGECARAIHTELLSYGQKTGKRLTVCRTPLFEDAVRCGFRLAPPGGILLLSPACTSFDQFTDYTERGRVFASLCRLF